MDFEAELAWRGYSKKKRKLLLSSIATLYGRQIDIKANSEPTAEQLKEIRNVDEEK